MNGKISIPACLFDTPHFFTRFFRLNPEAHIPDHGLFTTIEMFALVRRWEEEEEEGGAVGI